MLILASQSPRRAELLEQLQLPFTVKAADIDESVGTSETPHDYVRRLSLQKAQVVASQSAQGSIVLGSDTSVVIDDLILGKPLDKADCHRMLSLLSDRHHQVMTAISAIKGNQILTDVVITDVYFKHLSDKEIDWYWQTGEPLDKAGSYAIQGLGGQFVTQIKGSYSAVVGLPLYETKELLTGIGLDSHEC